MSKAGQTRQLLIVGAASLLTLVVAGAPAAGAKCCRWREKPLQCSGAATGMTGGDWLCDPAECSCEGPGWQPPSWKADAEAGTLVAASPDEIGGTISNGYVGAWVPRGVPGSAGAPESGFELVKGVFRPTGTKLDPSGDKSAPFDQQMTLAHLASWTATAFVSSIGSTAFPATASAVDFSRAAYRVASRSADGAVTCEQVTYAHRAQHHLLINAFSCTNTGASAVNVTVDQGRCKDADQYGYQYYPALCPKRNGTLDGFTRASWEPGPDAPDAACSLSTMAGPYAETPASPVTMLGECHSKLPAGGLTFSVHPSGGIGGATLVSARFSNTDEDDEPSSGADGASLVAFSRIAFINAKSQAAAGTLMPSHEAAMDALHAPGIEVEGNVTLAKVVNASLHALLGSYRTTSADGGGVGGRGGGRHSSAPEGLISTRYSGHAFWDVETWQWPTWLMFWPDQARALLAYRSRLAKQAAENAGWASALPFFPPGSPDAPKLEGLRFPWESADSGIEMCPGNGEDHLMGDIALAFRQYWLATHDAEWLKKDGWPVISGIASFYASRVTQDEHRKGVYHLVGTMGPDEYHGNVTDSAYSNAVAASALRTANMLAPLVPGQAHNSTFQRIADGLVIILDTDADFHPEFEGFVASGPHKMAIKQADTLLMYYPLSVKAKASTKRNDLSVYTELTDPRGPAMTYGIHSIVSLDVGDTERAAHYFHMGFEVYTRAPFFLWHEGNDTDGSSGQGAPNLVTGAGGFLQSVWAGYGGLRLDRDDGALTIRSPRPLPGSTGLRMRGVVYLGVRLDVSASADGTWQVVLSGSSGQGSGGLQLELSMVDGNASWPAGPSSAGPQSSAAPVPITRVPLVRQEGQVGIVTARQMQQ